MKNTKVSFTSADTFPLKLFLDEDALRCIKNRHILPIHVQLNPTNRCNQSCNFCSCSHRDREQEISFEAVCDVIGRFCRLGTKAITITGGGEPTLYKDLSGVVEFIYAKRIKIGLVTNGLQLYRVKGVIDKLNWCRVSFSDQQKANSALLKELSCLKKEYPQVDWGLSYVITRHLNRDNLKKIIEFTKAEGYSHIRIVSDLLDLDSVPDIGDWLYTSFGLDDRIIYQRRKNYTTGINPCYLSLLKPNIGPDGNIYPCCGIQYALTEASLDFPVSMSMGQDIEDIYANQKYFNGRVCQRCYYDQYNQIISLMMDGIKHKEFI